MTTFRRKDWGRWLDHEWLVRVSCGGSLAIGLFFVFVWSPLPWGWLGIDFYHDRALALAAGKPFDTTDVPWGYAYYVATLYRIFGGHPWIPLAGQVLLNALVPLLLYRLVEPLTSRRVAVLSAVLTGLLSFNTVYASTLASDCVSTVLFIAATLLFTRGWLTGQTLAFAASGLLSGVVPQFRPNLILLPPVMAAAFVLTGHGQARRRLTQSLAYLAFAGLALAPWTVRNYLLTHELMPTSTHGGVQLWYGTLQVGPYLESRSDNPRAAFESSAFSYTSLVGLPMIVSADIALCPGKGDVVLTYWTDRDSRRRQAPVSDLAANKITFILPGQPEPTTLYYYFEAKWPGARSEFTPPGGPDRPFVYFVSSDHLADLDRHDDLLDVFDLIRMLRRIAWNEQPANVAEHDLNSDGVITEQDVRLATRLLLEMAGRRDAAPVKDITASNASAVLTLSDGSTFTVPRSWSSRVTDIVLQGELASMLVYANRPHADVGGMPAPSGECAVEAGGMNGVFYRAEPHNMRRYVALALDNIRRDPTAYVASSFYRMVRLFVIRGSDEKREAQQFRRSRLVYAAGTTLSATYLLLFLSGVVVARRRGYRIMSLLLPIVYLPVTLGWVLTNMRYTITVQPLIFVFVSIAIIAALGLDSTASTPRDRA